MGVGDVLVVYAIKHVCHNLIKIVFTSTHTGGKELGGAIDTEYNKKIESFALL